MADKLLRSIQLIKSSWVIKSDQAIGYKTFPYTASAVTTEPEMQLIIFE